MNIKSPDNLKEQDPEGERSFRIFEAKNYSTPPFLFTKLDKLIVHKSILYESIVADYETELYVKYNSLETNLYAFKISK